MADRSRSEVDRVILAVLLEHPDQGLTIFELRNQVTADIDSIQSSLTTLDRDGLIECDEQGERLVIRPTETALEQGIDDPETSVLERVKTWLSG